MTGLRRGGTRRKVQADVERDFEWGRLFLPHAKAICGGLLIGEATAEEDQQHATDLMVLLLRDLRIAFRVRRHEFLHDYQDEFTIRSVRKSGIQTELAKITAGWGDYFLYGFAAPDDRRLAAWTMVDLGAFRANQAQCPFVEKDNGDGTRFRAYPCSKMPAGIVIRKRRQ